MMLLIKSHKVLCIRQPFELFHCHSLQAVSSTGMVQHLQDPSRRRCCEDSSSLSRAGPMMEHSRFHHSLPLLTILSLSPCRVQTDAECTQVFLNDSRTLWTLNRLNGVGTCWRWRWADSHLPDTSVHCQMNSERIGLVVTREPIHVLFRVLITTQAL